jgi:hypothetical protein
MTSTAVLDRRIVNIPDAENAPAELVAGARNFLASGNRANTMMPMMRGDAAIGAGFEPRKRWTRVDIAFNGDRARQSALLVPDLEGALAKCQWWQG